MADIEQQEHTQEEKFFGVKHTIGDEDDTEVEVVSEEPEVVVTTEEEPVEKPAKKEEAGEDDDELEGYSDRVQKRIKKLTYKHREAARQQEEAEKQRDEAVRFAQGVNRQNTQYEDIIHTGEARLVEQFKNSATLAVEQAREAYRKAYEAGDTDAVVAAQEAAFTAQAELQTAHNYDMDYQQRSKQFLAQRQAQAAAPPPRPAAPVVPKPTAEASDWAERNEWFGQDEHRDMTAIAYATHETLVRDQGVAPDSDEYYSEIDKAMVLRFPEYFTENEKTLQSPTSVVAPAGRTTGKKPRSIKLNQRQVALAKKLGITPEQYAVQAAKGM